VTSRDGSSILASGTHDKDPQKFVCVVVVVNVEALR
jgi:hypothetical protein